MTSSARALVVVREDGDQGPAASGTEQRPLGRPWHAPAVTGALVAGATALVALHSPYQDGSYGFCPVLLTLGAWCPACGGLRAVHDLSRGDLAGAWGMNAPIVALLPLVVVAWAVWLAAAARGRPSPLRLPVWLAWATLVGAVVFGVLRNVPDLAPWLAPGGVLPPLVGAG